MDLCCSDSHILPVAIALPVLLFIALAGVLWKKCKRPGVDLENKVKLNIRAYEYM